MRVYALTFEEDDDKDDSYRIGSHEAVLDLFTRREDAERVAAELFGKPKTTYGQWGHSDCLNVKERKVR